PVKTNGAFYSGALTATTSAVPVQLTLGNHRLSTFDIIRAEDVFNRMTIFHLSGSELVLPGRLLWFLLHRLSG
ncbi:hypothetical protein, partial [uncultured Parasutterella sp.]|uniref:hypothetical protein n=1 Tax=uncultured Parasutterella sp. TaxID=1263098 RepID=UPI00259A3292